MKIPERARKVLEAVGADPDQAKPLHLDGIKLERWKVYHVPASNGKELPIKVLWIGGGPKSVADVRRLCLSTLNVDPCIATYRLKSSSGAFLRSGDLNKEILLGEEEAELLESVIRSHLIIDNEFDARRSIRKIIDTAPTATPNFINRGVFSTHYLKNRLLDRMPITTQDLEKIKRARQEGMEKILQELGWGSPSGPRATDAGNVSIITTDAQELGVFTRPKSVAPSQQAEAELGNSTWVILTNGAIWRLYTDKIPQTTTNYFEVNMGQGTDISMKYLIAVFGKTSYFNNGQKATVIEQAFEESKIYSTKLEEDLSDRIKHEGLFLDLVKGILKYDKKIQYDKIELDAAKETALKIMYRIWFILYAEARELLPSREEEYKEISMERMRKRLDALERMDPDGVECWNDIQKIFRGIREGDYERKLPQYNGGLFAYSNSVDGADIKNAAMTKVLRGLLQREGEQIDYASLGVRHLGNVYESLMDFSVNQAKEDIVLVEAGAGKSRVVKAGVETAYSYKKNDLYLSSKGGMLTRKRSGSYYTPREIVEFLVRQGLKPITEEREKSVGDDIRKYKKSPTRQNYEICMDRLLDIRVLDPAMGSGHFLAEALNQLTAWVTEVLKAHQDHPLKAQIEEDRNKIIDEQKKSGIAIAAKQLSEEVLLKRIIMKKCIFGIDINPLAVELARLSLWLDSFAIGAPLTYMNHHIKEGDATIGAWRADLNPPNDASLDNWTEGVQEQSTLMREISASTDSTIDQVRRSEESFIKYRESMLPYKRALDALAAFMMKRSLVPKRVSKNLINYVERFSRSGSHDTSDVASAVENMAKKYSFFHWELEFADAFGSQKPGFDLIIGNPPWEKIKPSDDEFFSTYDSQIRSLKTKIFKRRRIGELLKNPNTKKAYDEYKEHATDKAAFYKTSIRQRVGDKDLSQIMLTQAMRLVRDGGAISILMPSQLLSNSGAIELRKTILGWDIHSLYVYENKNKIFPIHRSYRFILLTVRKAEGADEFHAGYYLHNLESLRGKSEIEKFATVSKQDILAISPSTYAIPETPDHKKLSILTKLAKYKQIKEESDGWQTKIFRGLDTSNDSDLLAHRAKDAWPVLQGRNIHQFMHEYTKPDFVASSKLGLEREKRKRAYAGNCPSVHEMPRLIFRNISSPTNMRTVVAAIMPPRRFTADSLRVVLLSYNGSTKFADEYLTMYHRRISYLCAIFNSMVLDFVARTKVQVNVGPVLPALPVPPPPPPRKI